MRCAGALESFKSRQLEKVLIVSTMGIRGLSTYVSARDRGDLFTEHKLRECQVVLDGSNLRYVLFGSCPKMNAVFGGDYQKYAKQIRRFFDRLLECGVRCHIVLDGAYDGSDMKRATVLSRMREQARNSVRCSISSSGSRGPMVLPVFARDVFVEECRSHPGVESIRQTDFEADREVARAAAKLRCPVLSCDSDFFVNDVAFLPLDSLEWEQVLMDGDGGSPYLRCLHFDRPRFLSRHGLEEEKRMLPLMSAVLGNDYVPLETFSGFFAQVKLPPKSKSWSQRHRTIRGFLEWLGRERDEESAMRKIMEALPKERREGLREKIRRSMAMYHQEGEEEEEEEEEEPAPEAWGGEGREVPGWIMEDFRSARLPTFVLDVACNGQLFLQSQVEEEKEESSHIFAREMMEEAISQILSLSEGEEEREVRLHTREGSTVRQFKLSVKSKPSSLENLRKKPVQERLDYLCEIAGVSAEMRQILREKVSDSAKLLLLAVHSWAKKGKSVTSLELKALAFCLSVQQMLQKDFSLELNPEQLSDSAKEKVAERMVRYLALSSALLPAGGRRKNAREADLGFVRKLSNLQAFLYHLSNLARLLSLHHLAPAMQDLWDGTFLFNVHNDLVINSQHENRTRAMLDLEEESCEVLERITRLVEAFCGDSIVEAVKTRKAEKKKKKRGEGDVVLQEMSNKFELLGLEE